MLAGIASGVRWAINDIPLWDSNSSATAVYLGYYKSASLHAREYRAMYPGRRPLGLGTAYRNLGLAALAQGNFLEAQSLIKNLDLFSEMTLVGFRSPSSIWRG
jgi:hypothetical protein